MIVQETELYKSMKSVFEKTAIWNKLQPALVKYITIGLEYPWNHPLNKMKCKPNLANPNVALSWSYTDEGNHWWTEVYHFWSEHYDFPATEDEEDEDDDE